MCPYTSFPPGKDGKGEMFPYVRQRQPGGIYPGDEKDYTIITPNMAPIHFELIKNVLESFGYHIDLLRTTGREIADEGLKYVHNDTCYPALLSIGQLMHALHSGKYNLHKVA